MEARPVKGQGSLRQEFIAPEGAASQLFLVERALSGLTLEQVRVAFRATADEVRREVARGARIRYLRSTFAPADGRCLCLFEASDAEFVRRVNDTAQFPFARTAAVIEFDDPGAARRKR
jgi:uncharacterized protein DUF4242